MDPSCSATTARLSARRLSRRRALKAATIALVPAALAGQSGVPRTTLGRYLELLSAVFLIKQIPAWSSGSTASASPVSGQAIR